MTEQLTSQQETLFLKYLENWRKIALSTDRINREKAKQAIKEAYTLINEPQPQVFFFDSPYAAAVALDKLCDEIGCSQLDDNDMIDRLREKLIKSLNPTPSVDGKFDADLWLQIDGKFDADLWLQICDIHEIIWQDLRERDEADENESNYLFIPSEFQDGSFQPDSACNEIDVLDFCVSELKCDENSEIWQTFKAIAENCGWIASYQQLCVVCDRPCILNFDEQHKLHGENQPAIQFVDGYSVYASHGERLSPFADN